MQPAPATTDERLLERGAFIESLEASLEAVVAGHGRLVLLTGEAGIGKTALVRTFCEQSAGDARVLWGACDDLRTPRPLGPFADIAAMTGGPLEDAVSGGEKPAGCFAALAEELEARWPTVVVLEDLHWADEATLDVLVMLGRRVQGVPALTIATYRDDGLGASEPLRSAIGELGAGGAIRRLVLPRLSPPAVEELASPHGVDGAALHQRTAGNPFFVTEVLAAGGGEMPGTVRDAVLARAAGLSRAARRALDAVAIVPQPVEVWLLESLLGADIEHLDECLASGMLRSDERAIAFRHELARHAVEEAIPAHRSVALHRRVLAGLRQPPEGRPEAARLAHHAEAAGDAAAVLEFAPAAAAAAGEVGAHREAAALYACALRFAGELALGERGALHERRSHECHVIAEFGEAITEMEAALDCYRTLGDRRKEGVALDSLSSTLHCIGGHGERADEAARAAVEVLEALPPGPELARAYCTIAGLHMDAEEAGEASAWAARAVALGDRLADAEVRIASLNYLGTTEILTGGPGGHEKLEQSLDLARRGGFADRAGVAFINLCWATTRVRDYDAAERYLQHGIEYCTARDLILHRFYLFAYRARVELDRGRFDDAAEFAALVANDPRSASAARAPALAVLGLVRARRGDPDCWAPLDAARKLAVAGSDLQLLAPVATATAEALWLEGRTAEVDAATAATMARALEREVRWVVGELALWRRRAGLRDRLPNDAATGPYASSLAGRSAAAAESWRALGCSYEAALADADAGTEAALRRALDELTAIGAAAAAAVVARRLRTLGARGLPRGPRPQTRDNPAGLTGRELEVVALLAEGLRNAQIAERLVMSERTAAHHVSAVMRKLDARTRAEAGAKAVRLGLDAPPMLAPPRRS
jgi:DNA-binding CsgD family transcriptional regulator